MNRIQKPITGYTKHNDATTTAPIKCKRCDLLYANDTSFRDHLMDCERTEKKFRRYYPQAQQVTT